MTLNREEAEQPENQQSHLTLSSNFQLKEPQLVEDPCLNTTQILGIAWSRLLPIQEPMGRMHSLIKTHPKSL